LKTPIGGYNVTGSLGKYKPVVAIPIPDIKVSSELEIIKLSGSARNSRLVTGHKAHCKTG
jgi:hypothetical protein